MILPSLLPATLTTEILSTLNKKKQKQSDSLLRKAEVEQLEKTLQEYSEEIAAMIVEPLVQGAGGMNFYNKSYLQHARNLCTKYNVLLIVDEIATGFGRSGIGDHGGYITLNDNGMNDDPFVEESLSSSSFPLFASQVANIKPDIICLGKAITGGYMTMGVVLTTNELARGVSRYGMPLMHGPTFMANPLACAVAVKSIEMLLKPIQTTTWWKNSDGALSGRGGSTKDNGTNIPMWFYHVRRIERQLRSELQPAVGLPSVADVRVRGAIGVIEMKEPFVPGKDMTWVMQRCIDLSVWLRPFGRLLYTMPPYVISNREFSKITTAMVTMAREASLRGR